jgi:hypothetical protein
MREQMAPGELAFVAFGLTSQSLLLLFFAARRWWPGRAGVAGTAAYSIALLGVPLAVWMAVAGSWMLAIGPALAAAWALLGATVDLWRPRPWRGPPVQWAVLVPYVVLFVAAQMFLWWPLLNFARGAWLAFLGLFVANTALNIRGHFGAPARP